MSSLSEGWNQFREILNQRIVRFLICGIITAAFNIVLLAIIVESFKITQPIWLNFANFIAIEVSVLASFFVYRIWVWSSSRWVIRKILSREIPLYHLSCTTAIALRGFILFPLLNWLGVHYTINNVIGITPSIM